MSGSSTHSPYYHRLLRSLGGATNSMSRARYHPAVGARGVTDQLSSKPAAHKHTTPMITPLTRGELHDVGEKQPVNRVIPAHAG